MKWGGKNKKANQINLIELDVRSAKASSERIVQSRGSVYLKSCQTGDLPDVNP